MRRRWSGDCDIFAPYISNNLATHILIKSFYLKINKGHLNEGTIKQSNNCK